MKKIIAFDLDYTITDFNTQYEITADFLLKHNFLFFIIYKMFSFVLIRKAFSFLFKIDIRRKLSFAFFKYIKDSDITAFIDNNSVKYNSFNTEVIELLGLLKKEYIDSIFILATASPYPIALYYKDHFGFDDLVCPPLGGENGVVGKKHDFIYSKYQQYSYCFVSDNSEDYSKKVTKYYLVFNGVVFLKGNVNA